jgi:hypothetical protein
MKSFARILSTLVLLTGLGVCAIWLALSAAGRVPAHIAWEVVTVFGLPVAGAGAVGCVLTGQLREAVRSTLGTR